MEQKKVLKQELIAQEEQYIAFLRKRLDSENYKANVTPEEYEVTKAKYEKAKFKLKMMLM